MVILDIVVIFVLGDKVEFRWKVGERGNCGGGGGEGLCGIKVFGVWDFLYCFVFVVNFV